MAKGLSMQFFAFYWIARNRVVCPFVNWPAFTHSKHEFLSASLHHFVRTIRRRCRLAGLNWRALWTNSDEFRCEHQFDRRHRKLDHAAGPSQHDGSTGHHEVAVRTQWQCERD